ncbi:squalene synthase HpnC [Phaeacidiphilus oryzae]|uniref:squalene synthase HpnC n=1 Tax=Phaeacidiphilus oryzae TaxID=348818 RepID=UPI003899BA55
MKVTLQSEASEARGAAQTGAVLDQADLENFPVAPFFLPTSLRDGLMAVYGFARLVDDIGDGDLADPAETARVLGAPPREEFDSAAGDAEPAFRSALLDALEEDLRRACAVDGPSSVTGSPRHPLLQALRPVIVNRGLSIDPFRNLIEANRVDQRIARYQDYQQLLDYCELSANPVGRIVLELADRADPQRVAWSDAICTALQIVEHLQDVAEDLARDRIYLPAEDLEKFGVTERDLAARTASGPLRELIAFEARRARALLDEGAPLVGSVSGRLRVLLAGFAAGGYAALDAVAAAGYDVLAGAPKAGKGRLLRQAAVTLVRGR